MTREQKELYNDDKIKPIEAFVEFKKQRMVKFAGSFTPGNFNPVQFNTLMGMEWVKMLQNERNAFAVKKEVKRVDTETETDTAI